MSHYLLTMFPARWKPALIPSDSYAVARESLVLPLDELYQMETGDDYGYRNSIEIYLCERLHLQMQQRSMHIILRYTLFFPPIDLFDLLDHAPSATIKSIGDFNIKINEKMLKQKERKLCS
jgi:hypothetical protein